MGWFWTDATPSPPTASHPMPRGNVEPPPSCPMHNKAKSTVVVEQPSPSACPWIPSDSQPPPQTGLLSRLNPLNNMPMDLSNERATSQTQTLPLSRESSTIPKGDGSLWEYPSPQQMYNAMLRKGYTDTPIDAVESMVGVHNFLNEGAWAEIMGWERRFAGGLTQGYKICSRGEENANIALGTAEDPFDTTAWNHTGVPLPKLLRFTGRPDEPTPKSQLMQMLGRVMPEKFGTNPPFDRHDWFIQRCDRQGCKEVRYVIDYYEGEPEPTGEPVFFLDVRPAIDGPTGAMERSIRWGTDVWWTATGGVTRELKKLEKARAVKEAEELHFRGA